MQRISQAARQELTGRLLPFWKALRDEESGGYYGYMDFDLNRNKKAEKGCILNSRILWFFSEAAIVLQDDSLIPYARHAYAFLTEKCLNREFGGVYWSLTWDGSPLDDSKHTYNQAFAIYGLSAYYRLIGEKEALELARELFRLIEKNCTDEGGYLEAFSRDFQPVSNEKLSENGVMAQRTMNTLLHVFEGYAGLYQAARGPEAAQAMGRILDIYAAKVYNPKLHRQEVFFDKDYRSLIDLTSYGHDIESSWLMDWGTALLEDETARHAVFAIDSDLAENILRTALQPEGCVVNECERGKVDAHRIWWVQAEAVLGFVNAWEKHLERIEYRDVAVQVCYITENGLSCHDVVFLDGKVHDPNRIDFLARYLQQLKRAAGEIDLRGYFQWSLMDNFEWEKGYSERFGLIYVDYRTQERILKDSAHWYSKIIHTNGGALPENTVV